MFQRKAKKKADEAQPAGHEAPTNEWVQEVPEGADDEGETAPGDQAEVRVSTDRRGAKLMRRILRPRKSEKKAAKLAKSGNWNLAGVAGNLTIGKDGKIIAWYLSQNVSWSYRTQRDATILIEDFAEALAGIEEPDVHLRVTSRPFPVSEWAERSWNDAPAPNDEYAAVLQRDQINLANADQTDKLCYWGVEVGKRSNLATMLVGGGNAVRARRLASSVERAEAQELAEKLSALDEAMAAEGLSAFAATAREMDWLIRKSLGLGCTLEPSPVAAPEELTVTDLSNFTQEVQWAVAPLADSVQVTSTQHGDTQRRYNVILTLANLAELTIPESDEPWIARTDRLGFPVEWSIRYTKEEHETTQKRMTKQLDRIRAQERHYRVDHDIDPPQQLARQAGMAAEVEDQMRNPDALNTRIVGHVRLAVSADTEHEAIRRTKIIAKHYTRKAKFSRMIGQYGLGREFVPMEKVNDQGAKRTMPLVKLAAGVPHAATQWGDLEGISLGYVQGMSRQAAIWNPWYGPENLNTSGFTPIIAGLGGGKTMLGNTMLWKTALAGASWTVLDPSSLISNIAQLPGMREFSRVVNVLNSENGALNSYALVPDPKREDFDGEGEGERMWRREVAKAKAQRRSLAMEALTGCLPGEDHGVPEIARVLRAAVNEAPDEAHSTVQGVLDVLQKWSTEADNSTGEIAKNIWRNLDKKKDGELPRLFFPDGSSTNDGSSVTTTARVTFYGLKGLVTPPSNNNKIDWSEEQLLYHPILNLAGWAALREIYRRDRHERKGVYLDEFLEIAKSGSGGELAQKCATDSRKNNLVTLTLAQHGHAILDAAGSGANNFIGSAFLGRTEDDDAQSANCSIARIPDDREYRAMFGRLSQKRSSALRNEKKEKDRTPREFIARDYEGNIEKLVIDQLHHEDFTTAADSSPTASGRLENVNSETYEKEVA